jgi:hypothetical protein
MRHVVWIGYEPREQDAFEVAVASMNHHAVERPDIRVLDLCKLIASGLYQRPTSKRPTGLFDNLSNAPMSTEFAISRFFVPLLSTKYCEAVGLGGIRGLRRAAPGRHC